MSDMQFSLYQSGRNSTTLKLMSNNGIDVECRFDDLELATLATEAVNIVRRRAEHEMYAADDLKFILEKLA